MQLNHLIQSDYSRVVAVEPDGGELELFCRDGDQVDSRRIPFRPFLLLDDPVHLNGLEAEWEAEPLQGGQVLRHIVFFPSLETYEQAVKFLKKAEGKVVYSLFGDLVTQGLLANPLRLFRDLKFEEIRRLQFDIETLTSPGYDFPSADRPADEIVIISISDSTGFETVISQRDFTERELLKEFVRIVQERDPDVIEGHNICRFDLPYLERRARRYNVKLALGRHQRLPKRRNSRFTAAERIINYTRYDLYGRHVVDTMHLCIAYDVVRRSLDSYGLKAVARHFNVAAPDRTYIDGHAITAAWHHDRERLLAYALDDVRETRSISTILSPSYFYQTQLLPLKYQDCLVRGNGTRVDLLLINAYLARRESLPLPEPSQPFAGGLTLANDHGLFKNVWHCDVRSLYPSIILAEKWVPVRDTLGEFPRLLAELRQFRLEAKDAARQSEDVSDRNLYGALQQTFKIMINSFYGYLGFTQGTFNDYAMAERVTARGREILQSMIDRLKELDAHVIEVDTDGIYFQPPAGVDEPGAMAAAIQQILPEGITIELDATYRAMFSYKSKNYALLSPDGTISITGAALKSRGLEPFQRDFMAELLRHVLEDRSGELPGLFEHYQALLQERRLPLAALAKSETLNDSLETYKRKLAAGGAFRRSAAYELALKADLDYRQGDQVVFYVTGDKKTVSVVDNSRLLKDAPEERDENIPYYLGKLQDLYKKFAMLIP